MRLALPIRDATEHTNSMDIVRLAAGGAHDVVSDEYPSNPHNRFNP